MSFKTNRVKAISKDIITTYAIFVKDKIAEQDEVYINTGIDSDFNKYEALYQLVIAKVTDVDGLLGVEEFRGAITDYNKSFTFPDSVVDDCVNKVKRVSSKKRYFDILKDYNIAVYETCLAMFRAVIRGLEEDGIL